MKKMLLELLRYLVLKHDDGKHLNSYFICKISIIIANNKSFIWVCVLIERINNRWIS